MKIENTADLLKTGNQENLSRTWILLSETFDGTLLRNRIALDMALEMGAEASETEFVDLYYDGEYRGVYLLAEKVEIGEGRVHELDYDALLKKWNKKVGQPDLDVLPTAYGENAYGQSFSYVKDVLDNDHPASGAYLLEWENKKPAQDDRSWFAMEDGSFCVIKSPKNASESMMRYISETFLLACRKLQQDAAVEEYFDLESMARAVLLNELSANCDGFHYSSTYFVLPAESKQFRAGPVWDFDLAFRYRLDKGNGSAIGFKDTQGWMIDFYRSTAFLETAKRVYLEQIDPLVSGILLGDGEGDHLKSYDAYVQQIAVASRMNARRWSMAKDGRFLYGQTIEEETALLRKFLTERSAWLKQAMSDFRPDENHLPLWLIVRYGHPETGAQIISAPWQAAEVVSAAAEQLSEAGEENFALWQLEAVLALPEGMEKPSLSLNGTPIDYEEQEDGSVLIRVAFEDPSYRPVDYYGEDIGLVYQYDSYVARYPEIAEMFGSDPKMVMEYFCEEGMYEGQIGNAYFDPRKVLELNSWLYETLGENWQDYYWDYIAYGHDEGWMQNTSERFVPQVADAL